LKNVVVILDRGRVDDGILIVSPREVDTKIPSGAFGQIPRGLEWGCIEIGQNPLFLGIFEIFRGGKGTSDHKSRKIILLNILPPQKARQVCLIAKISSFTPFGR
jgi:hypothetical protein